MQKVNPDLFAEAFVSQPTHDQDAAPAPAAYRTETKAASLEPELVAGGSFIVHGHA